MSVVRPSSPNPPCAPTSALTQVYPRPPTLGAFSELEPVLLDDAQHVLVGVPGVVGDQEVAVTGQQLDEGGAGARAHSVPGLGLIQGQLQIFQVPRNLQQAAEARAPQGHHACSQGCHRPRTRRGMLGLWGARQSV